MATDTLVADPFHIVRLANTAVDQVRRRTQNEQTGHRGRRGDPLYEIRRVLLTGSERLGAKAADRLERAPASPRARHQFAGDLGGPVAVRDTKADRILLAHRRGPGDQELVQQGSSGIRRKAVGEALVRRSRAAIASATACWRALV